MIKNKEQLKNAENKIKDLCSVIIKGYDQKVPDISNTVFNAMIGGCLNRMNKIHKDIQDFLKK